jgi:hypothetical protein
LGTSAVGSSAGHGSRGFACAIALARHSSTAVILLTPHIDLAQ